MSRHDSTYSTYITVPSSRICRSHPFNANVNQLIEVTERQFSGHSFPFAGQWMCPLRRLLLMTTDITDPLVFPVTVMMISYGQVIVCQLAAVVTVIGGDNTTRHARNSSSTQIIDDSHHKWIHSIILNVLCYAAVLWAIFRTWCWAKRNGKTAIDMMTIVEFMVNTMAMISNVFFFVNVLFAIKVFIIYKKQSMADTTHTVLSESQETTLITYIIIAFCLKCVHLLYQLLVISTIDVFFIDWERPKKRDTTSMAISLTKSPAIALNDTQNANAEISDRHNRPRLSISGSLSSPSPKLIADKPLYEFPNVTVWRTNFVANEWMELCGHRRLSLSIHILLVILVLDYANFANLAQTEAKHWLPRDESQDESQPYVLMSRTGRLSIGALISLFAMQYKRFGYYIHGLAANGKSDVNMLEMYEQLEREESDLCSKRGLLPNTDQQTFTMSLPSAIDEHYRRIRSNLSGFVKISDRMRSFGAHLSKADTEKLIPTYLMINKFLTGFIEHNFKDVDYMVREKSTVELVLDVEFADTRDKGYFYSDNGHSFEAILFYGSEFTLTVFVCVNGYDYYLTPNYGAFVIRESLCQI
ncbi:unnamed protein product [Oppiella nova]|uniref:Uncharacterized protein n=1 Tax=Oppiella nova TaxID=334625 RepID=A0A7R9QFZ0_9ACAR|nr:unnamed protein product [Oppiella nova]CAG2164220.1 unnamed protein product [Oppiella nova]